MNKESQNLEWKESWRDEYLKWICGFANAQGGKIIIGVNDEGRVVNLKKKAGKMYRNKSRCPTLSCEFGSVVLSQNGEYNA